MTETDRKINEAFDRLLAGHPEITDGKLTVSNICVEAGVSRASYYRSPPGSRNQTTARHTANSPARTRRPP
ncbi:hypothetical protein [Rhodococcus opacus]|uniref:hypothetical protein n=1 Tax=Rhodococcus opacus TaxID=37919 RepID=UPI002236243D|nr:hypothetical protein [Rhodococcus opacus]UZG60243.1 hypothetical protein ONE62_41895 [Rhodococcus opacus]